jgi:hypothetical protein
VLDKFGAPEQTRTPDHLFRSQVLYGGHFPFKRNVIADYCTTFVRYYFQFGLVLPSIGLIR